MSHRGHAESDAKEESGPTLVYSTFVGGCNGDFHGGMALNSSDNIYISGARYSNDFPTIPGTFQQLVAAGPVQAKWPMRSYLN